MGKDSNSWKFLGMKALALGFLFPLEKGKETGKGTRTMGGMGSWLEREG